LPLPQYSLCTFCMCAFLLLICVFVDMFFPPVSLCALGIPPKPLPPVFLNATPLVPIRLEELPERNVYVH
jgi:hypothetical protein